MCNYSNALLYYYDDAVFYNSLLNFCPAFGTFFYVTLISSSLNASTISSNILLFFNALSNVGFTVKFLSVF